MTFCVSVSYDSSMSVRGLQPRGFTPGLRGVGIQTYCVSNYSATWDLNNCEWFYKVQAAQYCWAARAAE